MGRAQNKGITGVQDNPFCCRTIQCQSESFRRTTSTSKIDKDLQKYANSFCVRRINPLTPERNMTFAENHQLQRNTSFCCKKKILFFSCFYVPNLGQLKNFEDNLTLWSSWQPFQNDVYFKLKKNIVFSDCKNLWQFFFTDWEIAVMFASFVFYQPTDTML